MLDGEHDAPPRGALERELLDAARANHSEPNVQRAWQRFASTVGTLGAMTEPTSGVHLLSRWTPPETAPALPLATPKGHAARALWATLGASVGSAVTATLFLLGGNPLAERSLAQVTPAASVSAGGVASQPSRAEPMLPHGPPNSDRSAQAEAMASPAPMRTAASGTAETATAAPRPRRVRADSPGPLRVSIADEVRALDAARAACRRGEYERCFLMVERLHRDHPHSALRPDAEVLAVEALEALGRSDAAQRRARGFLARYPGDPHAGRVRALEQAAHAAQD